MDTQEGDLETRIESALAFIKYHFEEYRKSSKHFIEYWEDVKGNPDAKKKIQVLARIENIMQESLEYNDILRVAAVGYFVSTLGGRYDLERVLRMPQKPSNDTNYKEARDKAIHHWDMMRYRNARPIHWNSYREKNFKEWERIRKMDQDENLTNNLKT